MDLNSLSENTTQDNRLFDEQKYLNKYTWTYYSMTQYNICIKDVNFSSVTNLVNQVAEEELGLMLQFYLKKIRKSVSQDMKICLHMSMLC